MPPRAGPSNWPTAGASRSSIRRASPIRPVPTPRRPIPDTTTPAGDRSRSRTTGASSSTPPRHRHHRRHRVLPRRPRLVPQHVLVAASARRQEDLGRVRRRLHGLARVLQRQTRRQPPVRLHRVRLRPDDLLHTDGHRQRARRQGAQPGAQQPLVLRQRHLPRVHARGHRPGAHEPGAPSSPRPTSPRRSKSGPPYARTAAVVTSPAAPGRSRRHQGPRPAGSAVARASADPPSPRRRRHGDPGR